MGVLVRRNAVLLLIGVELILSGSLVLLVASGATSPSRWESSSVLPLFVITIAAAEVVVALAVILTAFRHRGSIDLDAAPGGHAAAGRGHGGGVVSALQVSHLLVARPGPRGRRHAGPAAHAAPRRGRRLVAALGLARPGGRRARRRADRCAAPARQLRGTSCVVGGLEMPLQLGAGPATAAVAAVVALVVVAVLVFTRWYLADDDRLAQFAATVSLFTAAMMLVVHARDLVLTLVGWEVMGWCSYLLIGHWSRKESARRAAHKAFLVTRVADIGFVLGIVGLVAGAGSTGLDAVIAHWADSEQSATTRPPRSRPAGTAEPWLRSLLLALVVIGVLGKSAQFPFQDWLPDAMEGPTPASALIHAATMVAAGTVVLAQLFPVLVLADGARWLLGAATAVTMVGAAVLALGQSDLKRLLAWSTVSQVAIMLSALATATEEIGPDPALFHLWSHALFKSLLFLTIGWLSVVAGSTLAARLRGAGNVHPLARVAWLFGLLALAGAPFVVGGLSKEHVIVTAYEGAVSSGGPGRPRPRRAARHRRPHRRLRHPRPPRRHRPASSIAERETTSQARRYAVRSGPRRPRRPHGAHRRRWAGAPHRALRHPRGVGVVDAPHRCCSSASVAGVSYLARGPGDPRDAFVRTPRQRALADAGLGFDTAYRTLVARPVLGLARVVAFLDREVVDGYVRGAAASAGIAGWLAERGHRREAPSAGVGLVALGLLVAAGTAVLTWR